MTQNVNNNGNQMEKKQISTGKEDKVPAKTGWFTVRELLERDDLVMDFLIDPLLPKGIVGTIAGMPGAGKSMLAKQLCLHVVRGDETFLNFPLTAVHNRAMYVATEDTAAALRGWLKKQYFLNDTQKESFVFLVDEGWGAQKLLKEIQKKLIENPVDILVLDAFGDLFEGLDLNSNAAMRSNLKPFTMLASDNNLALLFVHHINKGAYNAPPTQAHIQGGSGFMQKVRYGLILTDQLGAKSLSLVKHNYAPAELRKKAIDLHLDPSTLTFSVAKKEHSEGNVSTEIKSICEEGGLSDPLQLLAKKVVPTSSAVLSHSELVRLIMQTEAVSLATAKRRLKAMAQAAFIIKVGDKYRRNPEKSGGHVGPAV